MGIEQLDEMQTFEQLVEAIKEGNIAQLRMLLRHARQSKYNIFEQVDMDGNTIMHHAIMQANRDVMRSIMSHETGREVSFGIRNNQGKTPYQCMLDLPETKQEFKDLVKSNLGPSWRQSYILNQFKQYLHYQLNKDLSKGCNLHLMSELPESSAQYKNSYIYIKKSDTQELYYIKPDGKYEQVKINSFDVFEETINAIKSKDETNLLHLSKEQIKDLVTSNGGHAPDPIAPVIEHLKTGHCNGLASIWLQCRLDGKEELYYEIFKDIIAWDKTESSLNEELVKKFEYAIQLTRSYHMDYDSMKSFLGTDESDVLVRQFMWEKVWGETNYQQESRSNSHMSLEGLSYFLQQLARPENEGKGFGFNTIGEVPGHAISAIYQDGKLYIYDSNRPSANEDESKPDIIKEFDLTQREGIEAAAREIRCCLFDNFSGSNEPKERFSINFSAYDHKGKPPGTYITLEQAEARRFYQEVKENKPVNPMHFAKKLLDIHAHLSPEELHFMYKNIVFDASKINEIVYDDWGSSSPLLEVIRSGHYPQAVQALVQSGANPNLEVDGVSPISEAKRQGMNDIVDFLEVKPDKPSLPDKAKVRINIIKIPANEREANILAVYKVLSDDNLMKNKDGSVPNIIKEICEIVGKLDPENEGEIASAILEIKTKIAHSEDNISDNARDVLNGFAKSSSCDFQKIRAALSENLAMDEIMNNAKEAPGLMQI
ncbi:TPA: hypothetical protein RG395_001800 [Legionella pneumophila]|nr:hypothetical protein [Legionella pneumophila]MDW8877843.1 hypothetical protein [Legionella pneumophila subsp. fraseri]MDW8960882.1 hypothetical protein [Legionella pneumophila subsp. fraseri]MDW9035094.1 hypothetical protein [Legionella pneumophila subsp. fraseri]MDW9038156.1 hypothetical protein [Legionella pneumophila subsp. fraseri]MDW9041216.1 hypothetical protein [Legionella pneumophila subsp. fraseri]